MLKIRGGLVGLLAWMLSCAGGTAAPPVDRPQRPPAMPAFVQARLPGSRTTLSLPEGLVRIPHLAAYARPDGRFVVVVSDTTAPEPSAIADVIGGTLAAMRERGAQLSPQQPVSGGGVAIEAVTTTAQARSISRIVQRGRAVTVVEVRFADPAYEPIAWQVVRSAQVDPAVDVDSFALFGIAVSVDPSLTPIPFTLGLPMIWERGARAPLPPGAAAAWMLFLPVSPADPAALPAALEEIMRQTLADHGVDPTTVSRQPVAQAGLTGFEFSGVGTKDGVAVAVYGGSLAFEHGALWFSSAVGMDRSEQFGAPFRNLFHSIRPATL